MVNNSNILSIWLYLSAHHKISIIYMKFSSDHLRIILRIILSSLFSWLNEVFGWLGVLKSIFSQGLICIHLILGIRVCLLRFNRVNLRRYYWRVAFMVLRFHGGLKCNKTHKGQYLLKVSGGIWAYQLLRFILNPSIYTKYP